MNNRFFSLLKMYSLNSLIIVLNTLYFSLSALVTTHGLLEWTPDFQIKFTLNYITGTVWKITYAFASIMNISIIYERIQLLRLDWTFLRTTAWWSLALVGALFSLLLNIPTSMSTQVGAKTCHSNMSNSSIILYSALINNEALLDNLIFQVSMFISVVLRDMGLLLIEVVLNILLIISIRRYYNNSRRSRVSCVVNASNQLAYLNKTERKNTIICFVVSIISGLTHLQVLTFAFFNFTNKWPVPKTDMLFMSSIINCINQSINFFILLLLNKRFRRNCILLLPSINFKKWFKWPPRQQSIVQDGSIEMVNTHTMVTRL